MKDPAFFNILKISKSFIICAFSKQSDFISSTVELLLAVQGILKHFLQHHSAKISVFFILLLMVQFTAVYYYSINQFQKIYLVVNLMSLHFNILSRLVTVFSEVPDISLLFLCLHSPFVNC